MVFSHCCCILQEKFHVFRIRFGSNNLYVFRKPSRHSPSRRRLREVTFEDAQEEILRHSGLNMVSGELCVFGLIDWQMWSAG